MSSAVINCQSTTTLGQERIRRLIEKAGQTFVRGTPVMWDVTNTGIMAWDGTTVAAGIAGIAKSNASNLTTTGVKQFQTLANDPVPNQPLAQAIVRGAPFNDGQIDFQVAGAENTFWGQVGPAQTVAATDLTKQYGMTIDTDGHWFVDKTKVVGGGLAVVQIVKLDTIDTVRGVFFVFIPTAIQLLPGA